MVDKRYGKSSRPKGILIQQYMMIGTRRWIEKDHSDWANPQKTPIATSQVTFYKEIKKVPLLQSVWSVPLLILTRMPN